MKEPGIERWLGSKSPADIEKAEQALERMGADAAIKFIFIVARLRRENEKIQLRFFMFLFALVIASGFVTGMVIGMLKALTSLNIPDALMTGLMGALSANVGFFGARLLSVSRFQHNAVSTLVQYDEVSTVGPLIAALHYPGETSRIAASALIRLLPRLQQDNTDVTNWHERDTANRVLLGMGLAGKNTFLVMALLLALNKIGDSTALPAIKKLAAGKGLAARNGHIREAAAATLSLLQQRLQGHLAHG